MDKKTEIRLPVSERAIVQRINRALKKQDACLRKARVDDMHCIIDTRRNVVTHMDVNLETCARSLGVIDPWEQLSA